MYIQLIKNLNIFYLDIVHAVGPIIQTGQPNHVEIDALVECYIKSLNAMRDRQIKNIVCCKICFKINHLRLSQVYQLVHTIFLEGKQQKLLLNKLVIGLQEMIITQLLMILCYVYSEKMMKTYIKIT
jgi:O-acetyl-ADP-ribose deacetylase (regulator of RNase III)